MKVFNSNSPVEFECRVGGSHGAHFMVPPKVTSKSCTRSILFLAEKTSKKIIQATTIYGWEGGGGSFTLSSTAGQPATRHMGIVP